MSDTNMNAAANKQILPFGTWPSSLTAEAVANQGRRQAQPQLCGGVVYWLESRPQEKGRVQVVRQTADGSTEDVLPDGFSARSKVHEYGGGSYLACGNSLYFVNGDDQQVYALNLSIGAPSSHPKALTQSEQERFADLHLDSQRSRLLAVCEEHNGTEVLNSLVSIPLDGSGKTATLAEGADFYSNPRLSPDGTFLAWLTWNNPDMPWDSTKLWLAQLDADGMPDSIRCIAGQKNQESIFQPEWAPNGGLYFVSDRSNWWNIYRLPVATLKQTGTEEEPEAETITQVQGEFATPQWAFKMSTYGFLNQDQLLATYTSEGSWHLVKIDLKDGAVKAVSSPLTQFSALHCENEQCVLLGASPTANIGVFCYERGTLRPVNQAPAPIDAAHVSEPKSIEFPTSEGQKAYAFFYPPTHASVAAPPKAKPPVIVICHGGPTGATETTFNPKIQYWTNRGFAVLDVNYRGSTGYGRQYRHALYGHWGERDVDDVCAATAYVVEQGWVHPQQCVIKGSSAGGYTVLAALTFRNRFNAGVSLYGIGDLELLAKDTHKFEGRYLDKLVGPYPQEKARYQALSPIHHVDSLNCPLLVFQGLEDKVVPPNQAEDMVQAVASCGMPVAYATYAEEGHGFRQAETIVHMLTAEQYFYQRVFELAPATDAAPPITIQNLEQNQEKAP